MATQRSWWWSWCGRRAERGPGRLFLAVPGVGGVAGALVARRVADRLGTARTMLASTLCALPFALLAPLAAASVRPAESSNCAESAHRLIHVAQAASAASSDDNESAEEKVKEESYQRRKRSDQDNRKNFHPSTPDSEHTPPWSAIGVPLATR